MQQTKISTDINRDPFEALVAERKCGNVILGHEIYLTKQSQPFAQMLGDGDSEEVRATALEVVTQLNESASRGPRPAKMVVKDRGQRYEEECARNATHMAKTYELNMKLSQEKWDTVYHLWNRVVKHVGGSQADKAQAQRQAVRWAAELYSIRNFVVGIIRGRLYKESEGHIEAEVRKWEEQWDKAFGDLVGEILNMQD